MGRQQTGTISTESRAAAMDQVMLKGLSPVSIEEKGGNGAAAVVAVKKISTRVPPSSVESFTRELANLLAAGLPLARALSLLKREASHPGAKKKPGRPWWKFW